MEKSILLDMYRMMLRSRLFEEAVTKLWEQGKISGEMHLGIGEEAVIAAIVSQLQDGDAIASDHRGTPPFLMRGVDPKALILEFLGDPKDFVQGKVDTCTFFPRNIFVPLQVLLEQQALQQLDLRFPCNTISKKTSQLRFLGKERSIKECSWNP